MKILYIAVVLSVTYSTGSFAGDNVKKYLKTGDHYYKRFDNKQALYYYKKAYIEDTNSYYTVFKLTRSYNDLGEELFMQEKDSASERDIKSGVKMAAILVNKFPDSAGSYTLQAMCLGNMILFAGTKEKIKLSRKVYEDARKAVKMKPDNFLPYTILGIYYRQIAGLSWFQKIIASALYGSLPPGSYKESVKMFDKSLSLDSEVVSTEYNLYQTYREMGNKKMEIKCLKRVLTLPVGNFRDKYLIPKAKKHLKELLN